MNAFKELYAIVKKNGLEMKNVQHYNLILYKPFESAMFIDMRDLRKLDLPMFSKTKLYGTIYFPNGKLFRNEYYWEWEKAEEVNQA